MAGKTGSASSNPLNLLPFERWGEKLAEATVVQVNKPAARPSPLGL